MSTYYVGDMPFSSDLYHHGIVGMRWGIRRFQNADGTLTPAGKERYGGKVENVEERKLKRQYARNSSLFGNNEESGKHSEMWRKRIGRNSRNTEWTNRLHNDKSGVLEEYFNDMAGARLRDMGYEDTEKGRQFLMSQPWFSAAYIQYETTPYSGRKQPMGAGLW